MLIVVKDVHDVPGKVPLMGFCKIKLNHMICVDNIMV